MIESSFAEHIFLRRRERGNVNVKKAAQVVIFTFFYFLILSFSSACQKRTMQRFGILMNVYNNMRENKQSKEKSYRFVMPILNIGQYLYNSSHKLYYMRNVGFFKVVTIIYIL